MRLAIRGSQGLYMVQGPPECKPEPEFPSEKSSKCKAMVFSKDGNRFAWTNGNVVRMVTWHNESKTWKDSVIGQGLERTTYMKFSPLGNILATWEIYAKREGMKPEDMHNLRLWCSVSGKLLHAITQRKSEGWCPQWTDDEMLCCWRSPNNEVVFYEANNFSEIKARLSLPKLDSFYLAPRGDINTPGRIACYLPGQKGGPGFAKVFAYPAFHPEKNVIATKSFMTADRMEAKWSSDGKSVLLLTQSEVDKTGASYYGKTQLHYADGSGDTAMVQLGKEGPIYSVTWSPTAPQFVVVYGYMPAKATLFNRKCESVFDFGTGPRNMAVFNPQGNMVLLGGFGNLRGNIEIWDVKGKKRASQFEASDATSVQWAADGQHLVTSTCAPRLRQGNGFKVWHYTSTLFHEKMLEQKVESTKPQNENVAPALPELWEVAFQPAIKGTYPENFPILDKPVGGGLKLKEPQASKQAYRPPMARGKPPSTFKLHDDDEPAQNAKKTDQEPLSKSAAKNKKRREAAKKKKDNDDNVSNQGNKAQSVQNNSNITSTGAKCDNNGKLSSDPETEKKLRKLNDKLTAIQKLKVQQKEGKQLEKNQIEKISKEQEIIDEIQKLKL